jgi:hypothetical protein
MLAFCGHILKRRIREKLIQARFHGLPPLVSAARVGITANRVPKRARTAISRDGFERSNHIGQLNLFCRAGDAKTAALAPGSFEQARADKVRQDRRQVLAGNPCLLCNAQSGYGPLIAVTSEENYGSQCVFGG